MITGEDKEKVQSLIDKFEGYVELGQYYKDMQNDLKALIEPEKWAPKQYKGWSSVGSDGKIYLPSAHDEDRRLYGNEWPTKELATIARDMNKRNQLILQAKHEIGAESGYYVIRMSNDGKWRCRYASVNENPELSFENEGQGTLVIKMMGLNANAS